MSEKISIHTMYIPLENVLYLDDWLSYHTSIGVHSFYLYDNSGSTKYASFQENNNSFQNNNSIAKNNTNKYGHKFKEIPHLDKIQDKIFKKYSVTKVTWQPLDSEGNIVSNLKESVMHLKENFVSSGLVAFIDMDEYIVKKEEFRPSRMLQQKYESRFLYKSVFDIRRGLPFRVTSADSKCIVDMQDVSSVPNNIHFYEYDLPISESWYNHYHYNKVQHDWIVSNHKNDWVKNQGYDKLISGRYDDIYAELPSLRDLSY